MTRTSLNPITALLLGMPIALFLGALISDVAYYRTFDIQWINFAAWLIAGALVAGGFVVAIGVIHLLRRREGGGHAGLFLALVVAMWVLGLVNALVHARDGWATMPAGLVLSVIVTLIAVVAAFVGLRTDRRVEAQ